MRAMTFAMTLALATAFLAFAIPSAEAGPCVDIKQSGTCGGTVCTSQVCVPYGDPCYYQSDCCRTTGFWCPEVE